MVRPVLLPDNNVWTYFVNADAIELLQSESRRLKVTVAACPAIAYEFLRGRSAPERKRSIEAITRGAWKRLMPEAYKESREAVGAIRAHRPQWLNPNPDLRDWYRLRSDWQNAWWTRTRKNPKGSAAILAVTEGSMLSRARAHASENRGLLQESRITFDNIDFDMLTTFPDPRTAPWWDGRPFESWRVEIGEYLRTDLNRRGTFSDWMAPWLLPSVIEEADWFSLWTKEISRDEVPLAWLRWAFGWVQATRKTSAGTPVDNQIATYLPECQVFVTSDRVFAQCVEKVRPNAPVELGRAAQVPAGADAIDAVLEVMRDLAE